MKSMETSKKYKTICLQVTEIEHAMRNVRVDYGDRDKES